MKNVKFVVGFAIFGFLLSFLASFRTVARSLGMRFLIALCFAVCFAILAAIIEVLSDKVLNISEPLAQTASGASKSSSSGNHSVDIVIQDEDLPNEEDGAKFFVGSNHQMLNSEDINETKTKPEKENKVENSVSSDTSNSINSDSDSENQKNVANEVSDAVDSNLEKVKQANAASQDNGFVPVSNSENADNFSSVESKTINEIKADEKTAQMSSLPDFKENNGEETLDVLPDLEEISEGNESFSASSSQDDDVSDFSETKKSNSSTAKKDATDDKNAELMAKAISTVLAKDKEE